MSKYTYTVQSNYSGKWISIMTKTRDFCLGFVKAREDYFPRKSYRVMRSDGKIIVDMPACDDVSIGRIAVWPPPEQCEEAARLVSEKAGQICKQTAKHEALRVSKP